MDFIKDISKDLSIDKIRNLAEDTFNTYKPKTELEERVYEVLSHKNWGASSSLMNDIASDTHDYEKFTTITRMMWEAMDSRPAAWRVVFKALNLLEHLVKNGSERCVDDARNHSHKLRSLNSFNYYEGTIDRGSGVREKSKQIMEMLSDVDRIREEREKARTLREKFGQSHMTAEGGGPPASSAGKYEGYGNDDTAFAGNGGGGGGMGGQKMQGFGSDDVASGQYAGRYSRDSPAVNSPTRVSMPEAKPAAAPASKPKKTKKKKASTKSVKVPEVANNIDLLSLDDPAPTAPAPAPASQEFDAFGGFEGAKNNDGFDAFASAPSPAPAPPANNNDDDFGDFGGFSQAPAAAPDNNMFPAGQPMSMPNNGGNAKMPPMGGMSGNGMSMGMNTGMNMGMNMGMANNNTMMQNQPPQQQQQQSQQQIPSNAVVEDDDDFGDFGGADASKGGSVVNSGDPMAKLVSLDGLSRNPKKDNKLSEPIIYNQAAAAAYEANGMAGAAEESKELKKEMSFRGIDGLSSGGSSMAPKASPRKTGQPVMAANTSDDRMNVFSNPQMVGGGAGAPAGPGAGNVPNQGFTPQQQQQLQQQQQMMMMMQQMQGGQANMTPQQMQQMMMMMQQMQQQQQGMGGGMPQQNNNGGTGGGNNMMGGQSMQGWR